MNQAISLGVVVVNSADLLAYISEEHSGHIKIDAQLAHVPTDADCDSVQFRRLRKIDHATLAHGERRSLSCRRTFDAFANDVAERGLQNIHEMVALFGLLDDPNKHPLSIWAAKHRCNRHDTTDTTLQPARFQSVPMPLFYHVQVCIADIEETPARVCSHDENDQPNIFLDLLEIHPNRFVESLAGACLVIPRVEERFVHNFQSIVVHRVTYGAGVVHDDGLEIDINRGRNLIPR
mmetsp:Transcript_118292/g.339443  ORF Transcript_118292/g.339443 Transcript_118292/m.339443 type:complete len:235 (-) Transcript_118292:111-815(-)